MPKKPSIAIVLEGGVVQCVISDQPEALDLHDIIVIDYDTDGADDDEITQVIQEDGSTAEALVSHHVLSKTEIGLSELETEPAHTTHQFKVGDWVQTALGRVGQIDSIHSSGWAIVQFGSGGPFCREFFDDIRPATPAQIASMEGTD